jgi:hypothetical protein
LSDTRYLRLDHLCPAAVSQEKESALTTDGNSESAQHTSK